MKPRAAFGLGVMLGVIMLSVLGAVNYIGPESDYTHTLKPLTSQAQWRSALGFIDNGAGDRFLANDSTYKPIGGIIVPPGRQILTISPLQGGGDLSADRTLSIAANSASSAGTVVGPAGLGNAYWSTDLSGAPAWRVNADPTLLNWRLSANIGNSGWMGLAYGAGVWVATAVSGTTKIATSTDGITWTPQVAPAGPTGWHAVTFGGGQFVALSTDGGTSATSPDGVTWTGHATGFVGGLPYDMGYGVGLYVAICRGPGTPRALSSPDGINWTPRNPPDEQWEAVTFGTSGFVAVGGSSLGGETRVMTSADGMAWTPHAVVGLWNWTDVIFSEGLYIASGDAFPGPAVATSPDGINWTTLSTPTGGNFSSHLAHGGGILTVISQNGIGMNCREIATWTQQTIPSQPMVKVKYGNGQFVAVTTGYSMATGVPILNSSTQDGSVAKSGGLAGRVWGTDASGDPGWQDPGANDVINVKNPPYNAVGNGVADDTAAIQAALDAAVASLPAHAYASDNLYVPPNSRRVFFPRGTYKITAPLKVYSYTGLQGEGSGSVIQATQNDSPAIYVGWSNNDPYAYTSVAPWKLSRGIVFERLNIVGSNDKSTAHDATTILNHGIHLDGALRCKLVDVNIRDFGGSGIHCTRTEFCEYVRVHESHCRVGFRKDPTGCGGEVTGLENVTDTLIDCRFQVNEVGILLNKTTANVFRRCEIEDNVLQIYTATTDGTWNGPKKEADAFYLPSVGIWLGENCQNNTFENCYIEDQYVHVYFESGKGGIVGNTFRSCTFNPTDSVAKPDSEWCAKHDIAYRLNLVAKGGVADGINNQAHIVFATLASGNSFQDCHFHGMSEAIPAAGKADCKRILFTTDNYTYPLFARCFGLIYDDGTSVWGGTNPRVALEIFSPAAQNSAAYLYGLAAVSSFNGKTTTAPDASMVGAFAKPFTWDAVYVGANGLVQDGWLGDSVSQRSTWRTLNHRMGLAASAPAAGTWSQGDVVWNSATATYLPSGWICVSAGPPAVFKAFGTDHIAADSVAPGTGPYAPFGITRAADANDYAYLAMVRSASQMWGIGVDHNDSFMVGIPDGNQKITAPNLVLGTSGLLTINGPMTLTGDGTVAKNIKSLLTYGANNVIDLAYASQTNDVAGAFDFKHATNGLDGFEMTSVRWFFNSSGSDQTLTIPAGWRTNAFSPIPTKLTNTWITKMIVTCGGPTDTAAKQTNCYVSFEFFK